MLQPSSRLNRPVSVIIAFGANLPSDIGPPMKTLCHARDMLNKNDLELHHISQFYATPCYPGGAGPDYVNAVAVFRSKLHAKQLLARLHDVEAALGRQRTTRWGQRTLDLDLLSFGDEIHPDLATFQHWQKLSPEQQSVTAPEQLVLPHPRMQDRAFVLVPLAEIAPDWLHPVLGRTTLQMLNDLDPADIAQVVPL